MPRSKKIESAYEAQLRSEQRRLDEMGGGDHSLDLINEAATRHDAGLIDFLAKKIGLNYHEDGKHALFWVAGTDDLEAAELLLAAGSTVHAPDQKAASPLMHAAYRNQLEMAKLLVKYGAQVQYTDGNGDTALSLSEERGHAEMAAYLQELRQI